jgi:hypothetical protein
VLWSVNNAEKGGLTNEKQRTTEMCEGCLTTFSP